MSSSLADVAYLDRNYGGVFILWDRLFGIFEEVLGWVRNAPALYLAGTLGLAVVVRLAWFLLLAYSLFSLCGLGLVRRLALCTQGAKAPAQPQQAAQRQQAAEHP